MGAHIQRITTVLQMLYGVYSTMHYNLCIEDGGNWVCEKLNKKPDAVLKTLYTLSVQFNVQ